ncbi:hypothetical protein CLV81_2332 [Flagellimonas meridianipacifica]|uniref:TraB family protein n=2 Tax=Flagellimonas meridianipacifica TaxID=1080225 RepID=A0A2T0M8Y4_9FLAO|nr:hypothetical protein CLV81_2332 [Allomuricauda pacifica]
MKHLTLIVFSILLISCKTNQKENEVTSNPKIALLGTFHFGETTDYSSMDMDNFDSKKRQKEMEELVQALKKFKPTKILLECTLKDEAFFQEAYMNYINGQTQLKMDEREQIGFRLASELNHTTIYCIDYKLPVPLDSLSNFAEKHMKPEFLSFLASIERNDENDSKVLAAKSLKKYYAFKNSDEEDQKNKRQYIQETAKFVSDSTYIGIKFVSTWWERNFHIMSNIDRHIGYTDRVLVLIGGAHRAVLKDFYKARNDVHYEEIANYLQ